VAHKLVGQIVPKCSDQVEDYICAFSLTEFELFLDRNEYMHESETLYRIPLRDIIAFYSPEQQEKETTEKKSWAINLAGIVALVVTGMGLLHRPPEKPDTVILRFYNEKRETVTLTFKMLGRGVRGLIEQYEHYVRRSGCLNA